jgi:hypothetical protein
MYWFSRIGVHTTYAGGLLGPSLLTATGLGLLFVPLSLVALTRVRDQDSGPASSLLNTGQQVGGAIGLAALSTVAWTAVATSARSQITAAGRSGHVLASAQVRASIYHHALAAGITRGFLAASGIALAALVTTAVTIRVRREDIEENQMASRHTASPIQRTTETAADWIGSGSASTRENTSAPEGE